MKLLKMNKILLGLILVTFSYSIEAQIGGRYTFDFLSLPSSSRLTALGGHVIGVMDDDINLAMSNPAALNSKTHNSISFNHNFHFADISNGHVSYGRTLEKYGIHTQIGLSYISYGEFTQSDIYGNDLGTFSGRENAITLGAAKQINEKIVVGLNLKGIFGKLETYSSNGFAVDLGVNYILRSDKTTLSFVIKNWGSQLTPYDKDIQATPLDIQIGLTNQLAHLPFRFSIIAHQLQQWSIRYDDPSQNDNNDFFGESNEESTFSKNVDNLFRHLIFNGEFLLGKKENLRLRIGYNHLRRKELSVSDFRSLAGFSIGAGIKINRFRIDYGVGYHHLAGAVNHLSISSNLNWFKKKKLAE